MWQNALTMDETRVMKHWRLRVSVDMVLRAQAADPQRIRARHPRVLQAAERALDQGKALIVPQLAFRRLRVRSVRNQCVELEGGGELRGAAIANQVTGAESVLLAVTTLGEKLDWRIAEITQRNLLSGMALDAFGTAALGVLTSAAHRLFRDLAAQESFRATMPLHPGMRGWELRRGQEQIFRLLDAFIIGVALRPSFLMEPQKSMSMVVGLGRNVNTGGQNCGFCTSVETCQYKPHRAGDGS